MLASSWGPVVEGLSHLLGWLLAWALAVFVYRARTAARPNRVLAALLYAEGLFQGLSVVLVAFGPDEPTTDPALVRLGGLFAFSLVAIFAASLLYLLFLATIDSPLARPFRRPAAWRWLAAAAIVHAVVAVDGFRRNWNGTVQDTDVQLGLLFLVTAITMLFVSVYGLAICISGFRRAAPGSAARKQAKAFALAFGGRDLLFTLHLIGGPVLGNLWRGMPDAALVVFQAFLGLATAVFAAFLAYGLLRVQLFDIDLRIKVGLRRSTVVTLVLVVVLGTAKVAELYLSRTYGILAGGIAAGAMLVLTPRLNRMGDKVANAAMPQVQPTNAYLSFKKLEVYRAAVESAVETGGLTDKEKNALERLREKLGLSLSDTQAVEVEVLARGPQAAATGPLA